MSKRLILSSPDRARLADRYLGDGKTFVKIGAPHAYRVGDLVFWATASTAGEGMFIGRLKASPDVLVLIVGKIAVETLEAECAPAGRGFPAEGASWRHAYLKALPNALIVKSRPTVTPPAKSHIALRSLENTRNQPSWVSRRTVTPLGHSVRLFYQWLSTKRWWGHGWTQFYTPPAGAMPNDMIERFRARYLRKRGYFRLKIFRRLNRPKLRRRSAQPVYP